MGGSTVFDRLDGDQREAVALRRNGAVSAGAGSGKTTVLAARYLDLVFSDGADVRSILCLTFTKKAQAEMQSRVWRELSASDHPLARAQVDRFSEASISTMDSFCGAVLRASAQDYGYAPDFAVDDERARQLAVDEALRFLLARREEPALASLFALMTFERAWKGLFAEAAYRLAHPALRPEGDFSAMPARAAKALAVAFDRALASLDAAIDAGRLALAEGEPGTNKGRETAALFEGLAAEEAWTGSGLALAEAAARAAPLANLNLQHFGAGVVEKGLAAAAKAAREAARRLAKLADAGRDAPLQAAILGLLSEFAETYRAAKRAEGVMGFRDAAVCAVDLLARRLDIRAYYKRRYRYVMVDEFQDDDELQKELLFLLAEAPDRLEPGIPPPAGLAPDKLFFVGDDKQSIYRFRGADVAVFNRLGEELRPAGATAPDAVPGPRLRTNYRSEPALVGFFNGLFARVFAGASEDFEARFEDAIPRSPSPGVTPSVTLLLKSRNADSAGPDLRGHDEALADGIARFIAEAVAQGSLLLPDGSGGSRPAGYDDFAILLRSTSKQYLLERFFRLRKLPYSAQTMRSLFVESPANDIYAALRLALLPSDRTAYATVLRSPLAALSDDGFVRVLASGLPAFDPRAAALLTSDDGLRYRRGAALHAALSARVDREPTASLVSWLWFEAGLRLSILRRPDAHPYLEHYDYLFALASRSDAKGEGASTFLTRLEPLMGKPEKLDDLEAQREAGSGIRLMTIHRSKGLEFPVVILPWIENTGQEDGAGDAFYLSEEAGITLNLRPFDQPGAVRGNAFFDGAKELDAARNAAETKRLFYVACTRAETHLVFAALTPRSADRREASFLALLAGGGAKPGPDGSFAALPPEVVMRELPELREEDYRRLAGGARARPPESMAAAYAAARILDRSGPRRLIPASLLGRALREGRPAGTAGTAADEGEALPATAIDDLDRLQDIFGTACHALIEAALAGGPLDEAEALLGPLLAAVEEGRRPLFAREARRLAETFLASAFWKEVSAKGTWSTEKGILLALSEGWKLSCRLDLVIESELGFLIVDFKSDRRRLPGEYDLQLAAYRAACAALEPGKTARSFLFWLRSGQAEEVSREASMDELLDLARRTAALAPTPAEEAESRGEAAF